MCAAIAGFRKSEDSEPPSVLYPSTPARSEGRLRVSEGHELSYRIYGDPEGLPALFLHGGPGAGCFPNHARFFDPKAYRIVLFDQRGCGSSTPRGSLEGNDTPSLVRDIEALRELLGVSRWRVILGGSWGVTLALAYAQAHPSRVHGLVLRGVCLMRPSEVDYLFGDCAEAALLSPERWEMFQQGAFENKTYIRQQGGREVLKAYRARLVGTDKEVRFAAARAFGAWEMAMFGYSAGKQSPWADLDILSWNATSWSLAPDTELSHSVIAQTIDRLKQVSRLKPIETNNTVPKKGRSDRQGKAASKWWAGWLLALARKQQARRMRDFVPAQSILTSHYSINHGFLGEHELLQGIHKLQDAGISCTAVQGGLDFICPPRTALDLHEAWPEMHLRVVLNAGHSMYHPKIMAELVNATDALRVVSD
eukprot:gnl/TRDRNA2_/TRDRNA2_117881_c1_seq2.p1 gnl/TRDRNA2_/TRDRNA2_117881_c1~~gnl/TRDRNA2_/TRDRNA2_117881_c1_seq2.p1  ORF type:complete len:457 (-),score=54.46 gnl/TRDRNA2_/TRDRNA2_117881_c1_seq2:34-1299(-)